MIDELHPYPAYKPSGVPWLGDLPEHWDVIPTRALLNLKKQLVGDRADKYTLLSLTKQGIIARDMENPEGKFPASFETYQVVEPGDLVFCLFDIDETPRTIGLSSMTGMITGAYTRFVCPNEQTRRFIYQLYLSLDNGKLLKPLYSGLRKVITKSTFLSATIPLPPLPEQAAIARYLDYVDRRIRRYVSAKRKLIALLEEEKRAIVNQAVTRGLDPNVRLKPSGVEWLGDVPEHWEVGPVKRAFLSMDYGISESASDSGVIRLLTMGHLKDGQVMVPNDGGVDSVAPHLLLEKGDLLFNRTNSQELVGKVGLFAGYDSPVTFASYLVRMRPHPSHEPEYLNVALNDVSFISRARREAIPSLHQSNLNPTRFGRIHIALPSREEQGVILRTLRKETASLRDAIARARRQIELLQEYRTKLIADVVTGKLDVRDAAEQLPDEPDDEEPIDEGRALADDADGDLYDAGNFKEELAMESEVRA